MDTQENFYLGDEHEWEQLEREVDEEKVRIRNLINDYAAQMAKTHGLSKNQRSAVKWGLWSWFREGMTYAVNAFAKERGIEPDGEEMV